MKQNKWALILGGASCVWDDVKQFELLYGHEWDGLVIAANDIGSWWPRGLDHWVSLHPNKFHRWKQDRQANSLPSAAKTWGRPGQYNEPVTWDESIVPWPGGSSGLFAVQVAQYVGVERAILCGIPMTMTGHFAETKERFHPTWYAATAYWTAWSRHKQHLATWVRSMSGKTMEMLGAPTLDWLVGNIPESATTQGRAPM